MLYIGGGAEVEINNLMITNGYVTNGDGGGVYVDGGATVTFNNCQITSNTSRSYGGGVYVTGAAR